MPRAWARCAVIGVFFLSGAAGLVYEVVWTRQLSLVFGVTTYAVATVLSTFMGGLALGSVVFGRLTDRRDDPLVLYGLLEIGVGASALAVPAALAALRPAYVALHGVEASYPVIAIGRALLAAIVLVPPTTLMGGTFPILVRYFTSVRSEVGRAAGLLYFVNTAGALVGCLGAGFFLIEHLGLRGTTHVAAAGNFLAGVVALALARRIGPPAPAAASSTRHDVGDFAGRVVLLSIGVSGFTALAYEVLWTRALLRYLYNSTYAFTTMLATFLGGLAAGSALHATVLRDRRRPLRRFATLEILIGFGFLVSTWLFQYLLLASAAILGGSSIHSFEQSIAAMFLRASLVLFLPAVFLGATLPMATEIAARNLSTLGRTVGGIYGVNTSGAILGSLAAAFLLIPGLGMLGTLRLLVGLNVAIGVALLVADGGTRSRWMAGRALPIVAALAMTPDVFRRTFASGASILFYEEGATDTVAVTELLGQRAIIYDDQRGTSGTAGYQWNYLLGHLPLLLHRGVPRHVLHICFGVGNSLSAVAAHDSVARIDNVELSPHVLDAASYFWTNNNVINHPKVHTIIDDGRNFVMASRETYDVILLEPPEAFTAGVINLFTREFYRDAAARLADDGLMLQWLPFGETSLDEERMLFRAFYDVFPNATAWQLLESGPLLFVGGTRPLAIDYRALRARMEEPRVREDLALIGVRDVDHLLSFFIFDTPAFRDFALPAKPVTDDRTVLDFSMPRYLGSGFGLGTFNPHVSVDRRGPFDIVADRNAYYRQHRRPVAPYLTDMGGEHPDAVQARVDRQAKEVVEIRPIPESAWRRWDLVDAR